MDDFLRGVGVAMLLAVAAGFWSFVLLFHVLSDWRKTQMGRHIMSFMGVCTAILTWGFVGLVFPGMPESIRVWVRLVLYGSLAWVVWWRVKILINTQIQSRGTPAEILNGREDA